ncbi:MAG: hypothetical protein WCC10_04115, partial [Tumebacillaceae bacterium]
MRSLCAILLATLLLMGCSEKNTSPPAPIAPGQATPDQVRWVYVTGPLPGYDKQLLYPDRDADKIAQILKWIDQANPVEQGEMSRPKRSPTLHIDFKDGTSIDAEWAWTCNQPSENSTQCTTVNDRALLSGGPYQQDTFVESKEIYDFLNNPPRDWMPDVQKLKAPQTLRVGEALSASGNGWRSEKVTLQLSRDQQVVWSKELPVDHGHFELKEPLPSDLQPANYQLDAKGEEG